VSVRTAPPALKVLESVVTGWRGECIRDRRGSISLPQTVAVRLSLLISYIFVLAFALGTLGGFITGEYRYCLPITKYTTFQDGKWSNEPLRESARDWVKLGAAMSLFFTTAWAFVRVYSYISADDLSQGGISVYAILYGWAPSLTAAVITGVVYVIEKAKGNRWNH